jgi:succinyl-CoA synthetase beta subunit
MGGSLTDILEDRQYAFIPTTPRYLKLILSMTKAYQALQKYPERIPDVAEMMSAVSQIILTHPEINELEINPLMVTKSKIYAADIKIQLV